MTKVSEEMNGKCLPRNTILQLLTSPKTPHPQNF